MSSLYLPGRGMVDLTEAAIDRAVREYDERLVFANHPETRQPTVFIKMEADADTGVMIDGNHVMPILAFHPASELHPEDVVRELGKRDSLRHGRKLLDDLHRHNRQVDADREYRAAQGDEAAAEAYEFLLRQNGMTPHLKSFRKVVR